MKIAYVYDAVYPYVLGGVERRVWEISHRLAGRGHEVHVFGMHCWQGKKDTEQKGVLLHGTCRPFSLYKDGKRRISQAFIFGASVVRPLASEQFDIIDCQQFPYTSALAALLSARLSNSRLVITWHEVWGNYWYEYLGVQGVVGKMAERILARNNKNPVAVSETTREGLLAAGAGGDIMVIPNGINISEINRIEPSESESELIFVGRLIKEKHVDLLIRSVSAMIAENPGIRCLIIGDGPERSSLEELVNSSGLSRNVIFTGFFPDTSDVIARMKSSQVFVLPSTREGFGIATLEALACGLPVVTIDHPGNASRELVSPGCGALAQLNPSDLASKVRQILGMSGMNRQECQARAAGFDWDIIADRTESYYSELIDSKDR